MMRGLLLMFLVPGCTKEPACEPCAQCPDAPECPTIDARLLSPFLTNLLNFPLGDGPTELWSGDKLVGVGFRKDGREDIYMFNVALAAGAPPTTCHPFSAGIAPYPEALSPWRAASGKSTTEVLDLLPLWRCEGEGCTTCTDCKGFGCYADHGAFSTGVWPALSARLGSEVTADSAVHAVGSIGAFGPFSKLWCKSVVGGYATAASHVDQVTLGATAKGWEFVGNNGNTHTAAVVFRDGLTTAASLRHKDAVLPAGAQPGNAWCDAVATACQGQPAPGCAMSVMTFSYP